AVIIELNFTPCQALAQRSSCRPRARPDPHDRVCPLRPRLCCKSLFALVIKNSPGRRRDFRVKMWRTSSPDDKLMGDLGNVIGATQIRGRWSNRLLAEKLSPGSFGLLQQ